MKETSALAPIFLRVYAGYMNTDELERVDGISRFYEMLWIRRDGDGRISAVFDRGGQQVDIRELHRSFITIACPGGFTYKGEFIPMENENEEFKRRALHLQRRKREHPPEDYLKKKTAE
jgi:hypothetical protein